LENHRPGLAARKQISRLIAFRQCSLKTIIRFNYGFAGLFTLLRQLSLGLRESRARRMPSSSAERS